MSKILAFDTATEKLSAAVAIDGVVTAQFLCSEANQHTERLIAVIDDLLKEAQVPLAGLDAIAFGAGPGAFTGLRVACGVAQGLGWAADKPLVCVSNLQATARHAAQLGFSGRLLVAHDARMHECYTAVFDVIREGEEVDVKEVLAPELVKPADLAEEAEKFSVEAAAGSALDVYALDIALPASIKRLPSFETTASDIALLATTLFARGQTTPAQLAAPLYVRNRVALTIEERRAGQRL